MKSQKRGQVWPLIVLISLLSGACSSGSGPTALEPVVEDPAAAAVDPAVASSLTYNDQGVTFDRIDAAIRYTLLTLENKGKAEPSDQEVIDAAQTDLQVAIPADRLQQENPLQTVDFDADGDVDREDAAIGFGIASLRENGNATPLAADVQQYVQKTLGLQVALPSTSADPRSISLLASPCPAVGSATIKICTLQGSAHISPLFNAASGTGSSVSNIEGIVTALASNGFYLQDPSPDNSENTSDGIFVFTSSAPSGRVVGERVRVSGQVAEFRSGCSNFACSGDADEVNLTVTQIVSPTVTRVSTGNPLPVATVMGSGGRTIPNQIISNDAASGNVENAGTIFDPSQDGIDFYESLEGMLVQINNAVAISPRTQFGEIWVVADGGGNASGVSSRGSLTVSAGDFNPERIQIEDGLSGVTTPSVNVGASLGTINGVMGYGFKSYEVFATSSPTASGGVTPETTTVVNFPATAGQLTVATFNVENLGGNASTSEFDQRAGVIRNNLKCPDIVVLEEMQDNDGASNTSVVDATTTFNTLISRIAAAGCPTYQFRQINPADDQDGGQPGGNIRVGFLFNPTRVSFTDRSGGSATTAVTVNTVSGSPQLSVNPGRVDPNNSAFSSSRKPLAGEFLFNGRKVFLIANHFNSKGGDQPLFGRYQPPTLSSETQRTQQATAVRTFVQQILSVDPNAAVIVLGDLNDFQFSNPVSILKGAGLTVLNETLPEAERYTYNFEGNAQALDHILVSNSLSSSLVAYDTVHVNAEFATQVSDHDPSVAAFTLSGSPTPTPTPTPTGTPTLSVPQSVNGSLSTTDPTNPTRSGSYRDDFRLTGISAGQSVTVTLTSSGFDTYLQLVNASTGAVIAQDDDGAGGTNSRLTFTVQSGITYLIRVTSYGSGATGSYTLGTSLSGSPTPTPPANGLGVPGSSTGSLATTDANNPTRSGAYKDDYPLVGVSAGRSVQITLTSSAFDAYLQLINASTGSVIAQNDDGAGGTNSRLTFTVQSGITYLVRVTSYYSGATGSYTVSTQ
jgi:hypothetical protein